jgi:hypothetical protein
MLMPLEFRVNGWEPLAMAQVLWMSEMTSEIEMGPAMSGYPEVGWFVVTELLKITTLPDTGAIPSDQLPVLLQYDGLGPPLCEPE